MSWFKKHLNLTLVLGWILASLFWVTFGGDLGWHSGSVTVVQVGPIISGEAFGGWAGVIGLLGAPAIVLVVTGWYLKKKNRSAFHFFWYLLFWIGAIILLCLQNRSENE